MPAIFFAVLLAVIMMMFVAISFPAPLYVAAVVIPAIAAFVFLMMHKGSPLTGNHIMATAPVVTVIAVG